jgi:hypothetical protein
MSVIRGAGSPQMQGFNSFSGVDIKAVFGSTIIGELQAISYSISREKAPLYTMGSADPRSYSRGKRGIAGTLIFLMFDRHAFLGHFGEISNSDISAEYKPFLDPDEVSLSDSGLDAATLASTLGTVPIAGSEGTPDTDVGSESISSLAQAQEAFFSDQVLPFDVTLAAANEYGALAIMRIYGCEILNEGYGVSIDDIVSEQQMSYVARTLSPWRAINRISEGQSTSGTAAPNITG